MRFLVTIEQDEAGYSVVNCPALPGCVSQGQTHEEALANSQEAILASLKTSLAQGLPDHVEVSEVEAFFGRMRCGPTCS